jgi:hypothetical protein
VRFKFKQFKLTFNRLLTVLAVASAGIGLLGLSAAQAAPVIRAAHVANSASLVAAAPDATSESFSLSVVDGCGKWSGTLEAYISGKNPESYVEVSGTLSAGCSGTSTGRFYFSCGGGTFYQPHDAWTTKSSTGTDYTAGPCSAGSSGYVELCWASSTSAGCESSPEVSGGPELPAGKIRQLY